LKSALSYIRKNILGEIMSGDTKAFDLNYYLDEQINPKIVIFLDNSDFQLDGKNANICANHTSLKFEVQYPLITEGHLELHIHYGTKVQSIEERQGKKAAGEYKPYDLIQQVGVEKLSDLGCSINDEIYFTFPRYKNALGEWNVTKENIKLYMDDEENDYPEVGKIMIIECEEKEIKED